MIILPDDIQQFEKQVSLQVLDEIDQSFENHELQLSLPKFTFLTPSVCLNNLLSDIGMKVPFSPAADFSGITTSMGLFLSNVYHMTYILVDEEGTEATAATAGEMAEGIPQAEFTLEIDHPFIFMIRERDTGLVLFLGRVVDETAFGT